jgi:hypothetical protein
MTEVEAKSVDETLAGIDELSAIAGPVEEAMRLIDRGLGDISERQIVSTSEVADLLLDLRSILARRDTEVISN